MGALLPFVLRVVAGACVGRGSGQPRMPPQERQHEGLGGLGDSFAVGLGAVAGGEVESCEGEVVAARDWHGACLPGSAFWK